MKTRLERRASIVPEVEVVADSPFMADYLLGHTAMAGGAVVDRLKMSLGSIADGCAMQVRAVRRGWTSVLVTEKL